MIYITGDTHGDFNRIYDFCCKNKTKKEDLLIILGDSGINFSGREKDRVKKVFLSKLPITLFCIHGNHEQRASTIESYHEKTFCGGIVYQEKMYPNILFAKDGEIFHLNGSKAIVIGGAYSVDKNMRLKNGYGWWADEQPSPKIKRYVEKQLEANGWKVDVVLTHTTPYKYEPIEAFLPEVDQSTVDNSTEKWLDTIEERLEYQKWYCGHFHTMKRIDRIEIMFQNFAEFYKKY